jgi:hypothetical protein
LVDEDPEQTTVPRGQPEIAIGFESQIEPNAEYRIMPREFRKLLRNRGEALFLLGIIWKRQQLRGEDFSLDGPFHRSLEAERPTFNKDHSV